MFGLIRKHKFRFKKVSSKNDMNWFVKNETNQDGIENGSRH